MRLDKYSMTDFDLANLFRIVKYSELIQTNIIVDTCESGGLIVDLNILLKSTVMGNAGAPGITLLAMSAQNQKAFESIEGGDGTSALLDCVTGKDFIQDDNIALKLVEIGRHISAELENNDLQCPVIWGLNLYGSPRFCKNPRYKSDNTTSLRRAIADWPVSNDVYIQNISNKIWKVYGFLSKEWSSRKFFEHLAPIFKNIVTHFLFAEIFIDRLTSAFIECGSFSDDIFRKSQIYAAVAVSLLPINCNEILAGALYRLYEKTSVSLCLAFENY